MEPNFLEQESPQLTADIEAATKAGVQEAEKQPMGCLVCGYKPPLHEALVCVGDSMRLWLVCVDCLRELIESADGNRICGLLTLVSAHTGAQFKSLMEANGKILSQTFQIACKERDTNIIRQIRTIEEQQESLSKAKLMIRSLGYAIALLLALLASTAIVRW